MSGCEKDDFCTRFGVSKPPLPYFRGQKFTVRTHIPPSPAEQCPSYECDGLRERSNVHPLDRCLLHPPLPGSDRSQTIRLEIAEEIRFDDNKTSQIGLVKVLEISLPESQDLPTDHTLVVKLYDTLYLDHAQDDYDPVLFTDFEY